MSRRRDRLGFRGRCERRSRCGNGEGVEMGQVVNSGRNRRRGRRCGNEGR